VTLAGSKRDTNATLTLASFLTRQWQLQAQYSQDLQVENGPKFDTLALRLLYAY